MPDSRQQRRQTACVDGRLAAPDGSVTLLLLLPDFILIDSVIGYDAAAASSSSTESASPALYRQFYRDFFKLGFYTTFLPIFVAEERRGSLPRQYRNSSSVSPASSLAT